MLSVKKLLNKILGRLTLQHGLMTINATYTSVVYNHVFRYGGIGVVILGLNGIGGASANNWKQVATLPTGFAPTYYSEVSTFIGTAYGFASVRADGTVWIQPTVNASSYLIRLVIPIVYS